MSDVGMGMGMGAAVGGGYELGHGGKVVGGLTRVCNTTCYKTLSFKHSFKLWLMVEFVAVVAHVCVIVRAI